MTLLRRFADLYDLPRIELIQSGNDFAAQWLQGLQPIARRPHDHNPEFKSSEVLLILQTPVHRHKRIETSRHCPTQ